MSLTFTDTRANRLIHSLFVFGARQAAFAGHKSGKCGHARHVIFLGISLADIFDRIDSLLNLVPRKSVIGARPLTCTRNARRGACRRNFQFTNGDDWSN